MTTSRLLADIPGLSARRFAAGRGPLRAKRGARGELAARAGSRLAIAVERIVAFAIRRPLSALEFARYEKPQRPGRRLGPDPRARISTPRPSATPTTDSLRLARRVPLALLRLTLSLLPVAAFAAAGVMLLVTQLGSSHSTRLLILEALKAYVLCRAIVLSQKCSPHRQIRACGSFASAIRRRPISRFGFAASPWRPWSARQSPR